MACAAGAATALLWPGDANKALALSMIAAGSFQLVVAGMLRVRLLQPGAWGRSIEGAVLFGFSFLSMGALWSWDGQTGTAFTGSWSVATVILFLLGLRAEIHARQASPEMAP